MHRFYMRTSPTETLHVRDHQVQIPFPFPFRSFRILFLFLLLARSLLPLLRRLPLQRRIVAGEVAAGRDCRPSPAAVSQRIVMLPHLALPLIALHSFRLLVHYPRLSLLPARPRPRLSHNDYLGLVRGRNSRPSPLAHPQSPRLPSPRARSLRVVYVRLTLTRLRSLSVMARVTMTTAKSRWKIKTSISTILRRISRILWLRVRIRLSNPSPNSPISRHQS